MCDRVVCAAKRDDDVSYPYCFVRDYKSEALAIAAAEGWYRSRPDGEKNLPVRIMEYDDWARETDEFYLSKPTEAITAEKFDEMLNILPPKHWVCNFGFSHFCMCEYQIGYITQQYAEVRYNGAYYYGTKYVRTSDMMGQITEDDVLRANGIGADGDPEHV